MDRGAAAAVCLVAGADWHRRPGAGQPRRHFPGHRLPDRRHPAGPQPAVPARDLRGHAGHSRLRGAGNLPQPGAGLRRQPAGLRDDVESDHADPPPADPLPRAVGCLARPAGHSARHPRGDLRAVLRHHPGAGPAGGDPGHRGPVRCDRRQGVRRGHRRCAARAVRRLDHQRRVALQGVALRAAAAGAARHDLLRLLPAGVLDPRLGGAGDDRRGRAGLRDPAQLPDAELQRDVDAVLRAVCAAAR